MADRPKTLAELLQQWYPADVARDVGREESQARFMENQFAVPPNALAGPSLETPRWRAPNPLGGDEAVAAQIGNDARQGDWVPAIGGLASVLLGAAAPRGGKRVEPARLKEGLKGDPGYAYHATNAERLYGIAASGRLNTHRPHEFTDQSAWPDGLTERRSYFMPGPERVWQFAPEDGTPVVLRTKRGDHIFSESTGDLFARKPIESEQLEYLGGDGAWHPVANLRNSDGN